MTRTFYALTVPLIAVALTASPAVAAVRSAPAPAATSDIAPSFTCGKRGEHPVTADVDLSGIKTIVRKTGTGAATTLRFELSGQAAFTLHLDFTGSITCTALKQITLPIPDTPLQLRIGPDFEFTATGKVRGDFTWSPDIGYGFTLSRRGFSHLVHTLKPHGIVAFSGAGSATLSLALAVDVGRSAGGAFSAGVGGDIGPTLTARVSTKSAEDSTCRSAAGQGVAHLTAHLKVFRWVRKDWTLATKDFGNFGIQRRCVGDVPVITEGSFADNGIRLTYTPPTLPAGSTLKDYICQVSPDGGVTIYPCNSSDGFPSGVGTNDPALAAPEVFLDPAEQPVVPGWSIAMATLTSKGQGNFGPWFRLPNSLAAPVVKSASDPDPGSDLTVSYAAPGPPNGLTIIDYQCEVSPDGGATVFPCDAGGGPDNGFGTADPAQVPGGVLNGDTLEDIQPGWRIRIWAVTATENSPRSRWFTITG